MRPFAGTRQLIERAQAAGWKVVVATSGQPDMAERLLRLADVSDLLPERVSSQEVEKSKPEPDLMHAALQKVDARPQDAWMLGDTRYDVEAAHKAGVRCAVVRLGGNTDLEGADRIFGTLPEVADWLEEEEVGSVRGQALL